ncbi:PspC domain-containing protein [Lactococcus fujiensis]|uniref:Stress-responsive transcriptional regulator, PspC family n=1 Tax=Lactococcus fujiensis JCM 16395 TaxID=1291764 RepID=A0A2A5RME4_9LACT|nr:PspC domain-containing protein [Lactococcus fujiensis]PCS00491.1 stress-responsive transcriptional regulator, PspC family [Lactococcus fujiensis JCM 16395]
MTSRKLTKSNQNVWVTGVIAGLGEYFGWGAGRITAMRIAFIIALIVGYGTPVFVYIVASLLIPKRA